MRSLVIALALVACKSDSKPALQPPPPPVDSTQGAPGSQNLAPLAGVAVRMTEESAQRPRVEVTAEELFAAVTKRGITLSSTKQVLAATAQAQYCALSVTKENIALAVCEYATQDAARAGKQLLDSRYAKLVPDAVRTLNGNTLLTIANASGHPAVRDQVLDTFKSL